MTWKVLNRKYYSDEAFAKDVDEGVNSVGIASSQLPFSLAAVCEEHSAFVQLESPAFIPLSEASVKKLSKTIQS